MIIDTKLHDCPGLMANSFIRFLPAGKAVFAALRFAQNDSYLGNMCERAAYGAATCNLSHPITSQLVVILKALKNLKNFTGQL